VFLFVKDSVGDRALRFGGPGAAPSSPSFFFSFLGCAVRRGASGVLLSFLPPEYDVRLLFFSVPTVYLAFSLRFFIEQQRVLSSLIS